MMKITKLVFFIAIIQPLFTNGQIQVSTVADDFKIVNIGYNGSGDYTRNLILLHEMYNGTLLNMNNAVGTITAFRGNASAGNRINIVEINSSSAYSETFATIKALDCYADWKLKTCTYNKKKYLALDVPYSPAFHGDGYKFSGWTKSTGENMKSVNYEVGGQPVNNTILSDIQDYTPNMNETHNVNNFLIMGNNVGIGTINPDEKLTVKGKIHTQEVRVDMLGPLVPDYVFENDYKLKTLEELESYIKEYKHLPEIPSAKEIEKNGLMLAEMNMALLKKMEEMTLYIIEQNKKIDSLQNKNKNFENLEARLKKIEANIKQ